MDMVGQDAETDPVGGVVITRMTSVRDAMKVSKMPQKRDAPDAESVMAARSSGICAVARSK
jgi:hypothetical protein